MGYVPEGRGQGKDAGEEEALRQGLIIKDGEGRVFRRSRPWSAASNAKER